MSPSIFTNLKIGIGFEDWNKVLYCVEWCCILLSFTTSLTNGVVCGKVKWTIGVVYWKGGS